MALPSKIMSLLLIICPQGIHLKLRQPLPPLGDLLRATDCLDHLPELIFDIWVQDPFVHDNPLGSVVTIVLFVCLLQGCSLSGWLAGRCLEPADDLPLLVWCQDRVDI